MFEVYFVNRFEPEKGEQLYGQYKTEAEAQEVIRRFNYYTASHGCRFWIGETF